MEIKNGIISNTLNILGDVNLTDGELSVRTLTSSNNINAVNQTLTGTLILSNNTNVLGNAYNSPALVIGGTPSTNHVEIGHNSIQSKNNETTTNDLYINRDGGRTAFGGSVLIKHGALLVESKYDSSVNENEGGEIEIRSNSSKYNGIILDQFQGDLRIFGIASADGTYQSHGKILHFNPYKSTLSGVDTIAAQSFLGNASSATTLTGLTSTVNELDTSVTKSKQVVNPNLLRNWYYGGAVFDIPTNTPYYSDSGCTTQVGTTSNVVQLSKLSITHGEFVQNSTTYYVKHSSVYQQPGTLPVNRKDHLIYYGDMNSVMTIDTVLASSFKSSSSYIALTSDGLEISSANINNYVQIWSMMNVSDLIGQKITMSMLTSGGYFTSATGVIALNNWGISVIHGYSYSLWTAVDGAGNLGIQLKSNATNAHIKIRALKLELGEVQTLAKQNTDGGWELLEIPSYGEEYAKCRLYKLSDRNFLGDVPDINPNLLDNWYFCPSAIYTYPDAHYSDDPTFLASSSPLSVRTVDAVQDTELGFFKSGSTKYYVHTSDLYIDQNSLPINQWGKIACTLTTENRDNGINRDTIIDRWYHQITGNSTTDIPIYISYDGLHCITNNNYDSYLGQSVPMSRLSHCIGKYVTLSVLIGELSSTTDTPQLRLECICNGETVHTLAQITSTGVSYGSFILPENTTSVDVRLTPYAKNTSFVVKAMKLEIGCKQTLARLNMYGEWDLNELPDHSRELYNAKKYVQVIFPHRIRTDHGLFTSHAVLENVSTPYAIFSYNLDPPMVTTPILHDIRLTYTRVIMTDKMNPFVGGLVNPVLRMDIPSVSASDPPILYGTFRPSMAEIVIRHPYINPENIPSTSLGGVTPDISTSEYEWDNWGNNGRPSGFLVAGI